MVHLGGNDLTMRTGKSRISQIIQDLQPLKNRFPAMKLIWSNIIPHLVWRADCVDRLRRGVNRDVSHTMRADLGSAIWYPDILGR